jgi:hypothetical protein
MRLSINAWRKSFRNSLSTVLRATRGKLRRQPAHFFTRSRFHPARVVRENLRQSNVHQASVPYAAPALNNPVKGSDMARIPTTAAVTVQKSKVKKIPRGQGRRVKQGTVLACVMTQRRIRKHRITAILHCSDRGLYDMMALRRPVPLLDLGELCDFLDMDPDELIDERNFLLAV